MKPDATLNSVETAGDFVNPYSVEPLDEEEVREWIESLEELLEREGPEKTKYLFRRLLGALHRKGHSLQLTPTTPYVNTISKEDEVPIRATAGWSGASRA